MRTFAQWKDVFYSKARWTVEASQDLKAIHNIDAEAELAAILAKELLADIDYEFIKNTANL